MEPALDTSKSAADPHAAIPALLSPVEPSPPPHPHNAPDDGADVSHQVSSIQYPASSIQHPLLPPSYSLTHPPAPPSLAQSAIRNSQSEIAPARVDPSQQLLFPSTPQDLCAELGLHWWAVLKLHEDGWLSFAPQSIASLNQAQEAELRFIGSLVLAGCDGSMLAQMLSGLARPYAYDARRLYFDWPDRRWRLLPTHQANPQAAFADWLDHLVVSKEIAILAGIGELARDALSRVRAAKNHQQLYSEHRHVTRDGEQMQG